MLVVERKTICCETRQVGLSSTGLFYGRVREELAVVFVFCPSGVRHIVGIWLPVLRLRRG